MKLYIVAAAVFLTAAAHAQTDTTITSRSALEQARAALTRGDTEQAQISLNAVDEKVVDINDLDFLRGTLALETKKYREAADIFGRILARDPTLNRVRLELARALPRRRRRRGRTTVPRRDRSRRSAGGG